jgi:hypothetical protein
MTRTAVFALQEGDFVIAFPTPISPESYEYVGEYLQIFMRTLARQCRTPSNSDCYWGA